MIDTKMVQEQKNRLDPDKTRTLWDMKELCRQVSMSENTVKEKFFYEKGFPKYRVGGKWYMIAKETEEFLIRWIRKFDQD